MKVSNSESLNEKEIISAVLSGNAEAFTHLVIAHQARIRLVCLGFLGSISEADDAAQDAFIKAYESLHTFKGDSAFSTWISRIASNHCLDLIRAKKRHHTDSLDALQDAHGDAMERFIDKLETSETYDREHLELLNQILGTIPEEERHILILREVEEMSYEQIAAYLQCSLDAVKGRLKRARARLTELGRKRLDTIGSQGRPNK